MINLENTVEQIERKVKFIVDELNEVRRQNAALVEECKSLKDKLEENSTGPEPGEILVDDNISDTERNEAEREAMQQEIDRYIRDIDHCLDLIKQL